MSLNASTGARALHVAALRISPSFDGGLSSKTLNDPVPATMNNRVGHSQQALPLEPLMEMALQGLFSPE